MNYGSEILNRTVDELMKLPGIGRKTAQRLAFYLLKSSPDDAEALAHAIIELKQKGIIHGKPQPIFYEDGVAPEFPTASGKIDFYSTALRDKGFDPLVKHLVGRGFRVRRVASIGEAFGGRDHGTVLHACRLVKDRMEVDANVRQVVLYLEKQLLR